MVRTLCPMAKHPQVTRAQAAAAAVASVRAEGLDPAEAEVLLAAWSRGDISDEQLEEARLALLTEPSVTASELLSRARAA